MACNKREAVKFFFLNKMMIVLDFWKELNSYVNIVKIYAKTNLQLHKFYYAELLWLFYFLLLLTVINLLLCLFFRLKFIIFLYV